MVVIGYRLSVIGVKGPRVWEYRNQYVILCGLAALREIWKKGPRAEVQGLSSHSAV